jgi:glutamate-1-semialdehyde 2,1-aminomutase
MDEKVSMNTADRQLRERARKVVPGGMYGHMNAAALPDGYPQFFARGEGCHLHDVDGRRYVDFMCSWGPVILGHQYGPVEEAAERQRRLGDCLNGPSERFVELAEKLTGTIEHADWVMFQKNGTDATTAAVMAARAGTGQRKILVAKGAYHGAAPWCTPSLAGVTAEDRAHLVHFRYNDIASLDAAAEQARGDMAAILVSPFRHDFGIRQEMADPVFARRARELCDEADAALILDDVRCGFRLAPGGSWEPLGVRPDLSAWSKAIANGYPLAAIAGNDRFRKGAGEIFITGSFWMGAVPMAAAIATLDELRADDAIAHMEKMGRRLREGLAASADRHGVGFDQSGPAQMPLFLFADDPDFVKGSRFCQEMLKRGIYMHPRHNMFLSFAHKAADIDEAVAASDEAFAAVAAGG